MILPALYITFVLSGGHAVRKSPDAVRAQVLADEGHRLMAAGDYGSACPKFASSQALEPGAGPATDLAACYEKAGKFASATEAFRSAEAAASAAGQKGRAAWAKRKIGTLQPKVSRLTITVPATARVAGLEVRYDGESVDGDQWGLPVSRDGGGHDIEALAPGKIAWKTHVELKPSGQNLVVDVPPLEDVARSTPSAQAAAVSGESAAVAETPNAGGEHPGQTQRWVGFFIGAAGVVGAGVGGGLGLMAKSQMNTASTEPNPAAHNDSVSAVNSGNLATVLVGVGAAVAVAGAVVWITAPHAPVNVGTNGSALLVRGTF